MAAVHHIGETADGADRRRCIAPSNFTAKTAKIAKNIAKVIAVLIHLSSYQLIQEQPGVTMPWQ